MLTKRQSDLLKRLYYDQASPSGFSTARKLWLRARKSDPKITLKNVQEWFATQNVPSKFAPARKKFPRATFISNHADQIWMADLTDLSNLAKFNKGYRYLLVVQDMFSRRLIGLIAQKNKTAKTTAANLDQLFSHKAPEKLFTDRGDNQCGNVLCT